jgi:hypothetical protein
MSIIPEVNRAMTLKESSKIGSFFCVIFATDTILFLTKRFQRVHLQMIKAANAPLFIKNGGNMNMQKVKNVDGNVAKMAGVNKFLRIYYTRAMELYR